MKVALTAKRFKALSEQVFWPAVAGNIFWAFWQMIDKVPCKDALPRLVFFALVMIYLSYEWLAATEEREPAPVHSEGAVFLDLVLIGAIVFCTYAASIEPKDEPTWFGLAPPLVCSLAFGYVVALIGHLAKAFSAKEWPEIGAAVFANLLGLAILAVFTFKWRSVIAYGPPLSFFVSVGLWISIRQGCWKSVLDNIRKPAATAPAAEPAPSAAVERKD